MSEPEVDPIRVVNPLPLDRRFATFNLRVGNAPRASDHATSIGGSVQFGQRIQPGTSGRDYTISIKAAFLEIQGVNAQFQHDVKSEMRLQKASADFTETHQSQHGWKVGAGIQAEASASLIVPSAKGQAEGHAQTSAGSKHQSAGKLKHEIYRAQWSAGGLQIGTPARGDPGRGDGVLQGSYSDGEWGYLCPDRGVKQYGCVIRLLLQSGSLLVSRNEPGVLDRLQTKSDARRDAFEGLKNAVAAWIVEKNLRACQPDLGHDRDRNEVVLALAHISVDLATFLRPPGELTADAIECAALPRALVGPKIPPPLDRADQPSPVALTSEKPKRKPRKARSDD